MIVCTVTCLDLLRHHRKWDLLEAVHPHTIAVPRALGDQISPRMAPTFVIGEEANNPAKNLVTSTEVKFGLTAVPSEKSVRPIIGEIGRAHV